MTALSLARRFLLVPLVVPISAAFAPSRLEAEAGAFGTWLGKAAASIHAVCAARPPSAPPAPDVEAALADAPVPLSAPVSPAGSKKRRGASKAKPAPAQSAEFAGGLYVGKETVLRLASAGIVPAASPVGATAEHPAGLALHGVGALGIGLVDGDILTDVEGRPVQSEGQVVGLVVGARSRHAEQMSAVFYRHARDANGSAASASATGANGGNVTAAATRMQRWSLVVAMPYL